MKFLVCHGLEIISTYICIHICTYIYIYIYTHISIHAFQIRFEFTSSICVCSCAASSFPSPLSLASSRSSLPPVSPLEESAGSDGLAGNDGSAAAELPCRFRAAGSNEKAGKEEGDREEGNDALDGCAPGGEVSSSVEPWKRFIELPWPTSFGNPARVRAAETIRSPAREV